MVVLVQGLANVFLFANLISLDGKLSRCHLGTYETGFRNELAQSLLSLTVQEMKFGGELIYNESKVLVIDHKSTEPVWVGDPTAEMDSLWDNLEDGRFTISRFSYI